MGERRGSHLSQEQIAREMQNMQRNPNYQGVSRENAYKYAYNGRNKYPSQGRVNAASSRPPI